MTETDPAECLGDGVCTNPRCERHGMKDTPVVTDEAVEKLARTYYEILGWDWDDLDTDLKDHDENKATILREFRAALEAAAPLLGTRPQPTLRAALERYFSNGGPDTPIRTTWHDGVEHWEAPASDIRALIEGNTDEPAAIRPLPTREQIAEAAHRETEAHMWLSDDCWGSCSEHYLNQADAVRRLFSEGGE